MAVGTVQKKLFILFGLINALAVAPNTARLAGNGMGLVFNIRVSWI
jgi:hypothetical protein